MGWTMQELGVHKAKQEFDVDGPKKKLAFDWDRYVITWALSSQTRI